MAAVLGIDTSNYKTSAAVYDESKGLPFFCGKPLYVPRGGRGLRQSEAVFSHVKNAPEVLQEAFFGFFQREKPEIAAVGAADAPREAKGSYMPCFLAGTAFAAGIAASHGVPLYHFSHQAGHCAAAAYGAGRPELLSRDFLAWHLSGGTSELLLVSPDDERVIRCERLGGSADLPAGQLIDRVGVALGMDFPCGPALEAAARGHYDGAKGAAIRVLDLEMSLSGLENLAGGMIARGRPAGEVAAFLIKSIYSSLSRVTAKAARERGGLPILCCGGVMANTYIRQGMEREFGAVFAPPEYSADNAAGIAILAAAKHGREQGINQRGEMR